MAGLAMTIESLKKSQGFFSFDAFLIEKMGFRPAADTCQSGITEQMRLDAYHECIRRIGTNHVAAVQTIQKWFGIHGRSTPDRDAVFRLAFALHLPYGEAEEYLVEGIGETGFQINDYQEAIFLYSLQKNYSYDEAVSLIDEFEDRLSDITQIISHNETSKLWEMFMLKKDLNREDFLQWMLEHGSYFKGYGMTALNYLRAFKQEILSEVKTDAQLRLQELLEETSFFRWEKANGYPAKKRHMTIPKFIYGAEDETGKKVSEALGENILELMEISELSPDSNSELLLELYASATEKNNLKPDKRKRVGNLSWNLMDNKYLSELLNIGAWKEKQMRLRLLQRKLALMPPDKKCPKDVLVQAEVCGYSKKKGTSIAKLQEWITVSLVQTARRIRMIQRKDLLPLIVTTAQLRYLHQLEQSGEMYQQDTGRMLFKKLANTTLTACCMECLNIEKYKMDALFWNCYQEEEMYSVSDVLELI